MQPESLVWIFGSLAYRSARGTIGCIPKADVARAEAVLRQDDEDPSCACDMCGASVEDGGECLACEACGSMRHARCHDDTGEVELGAWLCARCCTRRPTAADGGNEHTDSDDDSDDD